MLTIFDKNIFIGSPQNQLELVSTREGGGCNQLSCTPPPGGGEQIKLVCIHVQWSDWGSQGRGLENFVNTRMTRKCDKSENVH